MDLSQVLQHAINNGKVAAVQHLLQQNMLNLRAPENSQVLWLAIARDQPQIIELLIRAGADLAALDPFDFGYSILHDLVRKSENGNKAYENLALLALEHGADVNARDDEDQSVFEFAVEADSIVLMKALLERGAQVNNDNFDDILEKAADGENAAEVLPMLITLNHPSAEIRSERSVTAIIAQLSSPEYNFRTFENILNMVIDVDQIGPDGNTMLVAAAASGRTDAVSALLQRGADINKKTTQGELPIYAAATSSSSLITKLLISFGASIHDRCVNGQYPIHGACRSRTAENLHYLLSLGASFNVTDHNGQYPIHIAFSKIIPYGEEIVHSLLSLGASINVTDVQGNTPFSRSTNSPLAFNILFVKQFALLHVTNGEVSERDWNIIKENPELFKLYQVCYNELLTMSQTKIFDNFNLLTLLTTNTTSLSAYLRNTEFTDAMGNYIRRQSTQFSIYLKQFRMALQLAKRKRDVVQHTEDVLEQAFPIPIPHLAIEKITRYMLAEDFVRIELDFYSLLYKRIQTNGRDFISSVMY